MDAEGEEGGGRVNGGWKCDELEARERGREDQERVNWKRLKMRWREGKDGEEEVEGEKVGADSLIENEREEYYVGNGV